MKKKRYIVLLIILAIYVIAMYFFLGANHLKKEKDYTTILVGDSTIWNYSNKKWLNVTSKSTIKDINWKEFTVYIDNKKLGNYYLWHDDKWYLFDKDKNAVNSSGNLFAYRSNFPLKVKEFSTEPIVNMDVVSQVLEENKLDVSSKFTVNTLTKFDIDNDNILEEFYIISNVFAIDFVPDTLFSIVFMVKGNQIYYIYRDIAPNKTTNGCKPYFNSFFDVDLDNKYEFILSCGRYSVKQPVDMLYKFEKDEFKILISNQ